MKAFILFRRGKGAMMHITMVITAEIKQIGFNVSITKYYLLECLCYGQRIIKNAEGIDITPEFMFHKQAANILGKT